MTKEGTEKRGGRKRELGKARGLLWPCACRDGLCRTLTFLGRGAGKWRGKLHGTRYMLVSDKGGSWVLPRPQWFPGKPLPPFPRRQDLPVPSSWKPKFVKVPTVFSSHISNHFLSSSSQDLGRGATWSGQGRSVWEPFAALTPSPRALTSFCFGRASSGSAGRRR